MLRMVKRRRTRLLHRSATPPVSSGTLLGGGATAIISNLLQEG